MSAALTTNVDQKLLRATKFPPEFNTKVDMKKVNIHLIKSWIASEVARILQNEDDVVTELVCTIIEGSRYPNIKTLQIQLTGFLDKDAAPFCRTLWQLCLSAQDNPQGIPKELIEAKKADLIQEKQEREEAIKRQELEREREREHELELARIRDRERSERGRGRGGGGRGFDRRPPPRRDSRSRTRSRTPPRRRRDDDDFYRSRRGIDTYVPSRQPRRRRSPSSGPSQSRSRSPPRRRRNTSSERSQSQDRKTNRYRPRSPASRRSPSPRRDRRRAHSSPYRSRSPPTKRSRRASPSPVRRDTTESHSSARSSTPPAKRKKETVLAPDDLMAVSRRNESKRQDPLRLSREKTSPSRSRSRTPLTNERSRRGSTQHNERRKHSAIEDQSKTKAGAEEKEKEEGTTSSQPLHTGKSAGSPTQQRHANLLREKVLKQQLMARKELKRRDSIVTDSPR